MLEVRIAVIFLAGRKFIGCSVLFLDLVPGVFIGESLLSYRFIILQFSACILMLQSKVKKLCVILSFSDFFG